MNPFLRLLTVNPSLAGYIFDGGHSPKAVTHVAISCQERLQALLKANAAGQELDDQELRSCALKLRAANGRASAPTLALTFQDLLASTWNPANARVTIPGLGETLIHTNVMTQLMAAPVKQGQTLTLSMQDWDAEHLVGEGNPVSTFDVQATGQAEALHLDIVNVANPEHRLRLGIEINAGMPSVHVYGGDHDEVVVSAFAHAADGHISVRPGDRSTALRHVDKMWPTADDVGPNADQPRGPRG